MQPAAGKKEITLSLRCDDGGEGDNDEIDDEMRKWIKQGTSTFPDGAPVGCFVCGGGYPLVKAPR